MTLRNLLASTALATALALSGSTAHAQDAQTCQPGIGGAFVAHPTQYQALIDALVPALGDIATQLPAVVNAATYNTLLATANTLAGSIATGRVVLTLPDGTVVIDTNRDDNTVAANSNSYDHFIAKTINENHNSRLAILAAQEYACGAGLETKFSTSTGKNEHYLAIRLGNQLDSAGTVRISIVE